jgi:hypothetical protein
MDFAWRRAIDLIAATQSSSIKGEDFSSTFSLLSLPLDGGGEVRVNAERGEVQPRKSYWTD